MIYFGYRVGFILIIQ